MSAISWLNKLCPKPANSFGWICFQLGVFVLPSSAFLAALFLVIALFLGSLNRKILFWQDPWNIPLLISSILMILGSIRAYSGSLAWFGLANWLPFFWVFWGSQPYLTTVKSRNRLAFWFIAGTFPVWITGLGQLWFGWEGPWQVFGGLIIWFMSPGGEPLGRLSGLFDYANIAGAWLALVWPFTLATLLQPNLYWRHRFIAMTIATAVVAALILTDSRNAWGSLILAIPFVLGPARWYWLLPILCTLLAPIGLAVLPGVRLDLQSWARDIVPEGIWSRLNDVRYANQRILASTRLNQWISSLSLIVERPWLGWGAAAFSVLYPLKTGQWHGHAHNLPLEIAVSHGLPVAILIVCFVIALLITSLKRGVLSQKASRQSRFSHTSIFDRAWWTSCLILVCLHGTDMPFFDSRINIAGWILLAGLRCLIMNSQEFNINNRSDERIVAGA